MRITCPNCGAQYEVPDEVIPSEGRDVQCSNCGNTWFQAHPDFATEAEEIEAKAPPPRAPAGAPEPEVEPDDEFEEDLEEEDEAPPPAPPPPAPPRREVEPSVSDILREEAARETRLREGEAGGLETQGDLGLDNVGDDEASRRSREARERMARMRGETGEDSAVAASGRSTMLPDIDEINSTLRSDDEDQGIPSEIEAAMLPEQRRGGFARGFGLVLLIVILLVLIYANADKIVEAAPGLQGPVEAYVDGVNSIRIWLDSKLSGFIPQ